MHLEKYFGIFFSSLSCSSSFSQPARSASVFASHRGVTVDFFPETLRGHDGAYQQCTKKV